MYLSGNWLWVLVAGKVLIFLLQNLPPAKVLSKLKYDGSVLSYFGKMFECPLCLGVWIYFILCCFFHTFAGPYVPLVSEAITAGFLSFVVHTFSLGWQLQFGTFEDQDAL